MVADGRLTCLRRIRLFVKDSLGTIPKGTTENDDGSIKTPKPDKTETPEPVPAPMPQDGPPPRAIPAEPPAPAPSGIDTDKLQAAIVNGVTSEIPKLLADHFGPVEQRLQNSIAQHGPDLKSLPGDVKDAIVPELPAIGKTLAADLLPQVSSALPGLLPIAGAVGGPVGLGIVVAAYLLRAVLKRNAASQAAGQPTTALPDLSGVVANIGNQIASHAHAALSARLNQQPPSSDAPPLPPTGPGAKPVPVVMQGAPGPATVIPERTFTQIEIDVTAKALDWALDQVVRRFPGSEGTAATIQSLVSQYRSGIQPAPAHPTSQGA
jgi:hypothetical protein